ncbi:MAG: hypothetical protein JO316_00490 [Abitibacteriaceae bacterium]|nr:hypothetical protein [Abditibacteriaceae bacterium]
MEVVESLIEQGVPEATKAYAAEVKTRLAADTAVDPGVVELDLHDDCAEYYQDHYGDDFEEKWAALMDNVPAAL